MQAKVVDNFDGTYSVSYPVTEFGAYDIDVSLNGKPVTQSRKEYYCFVKVGEVVATGAGLTEAVLDESANFSLETKDVDGVTTPIGEDRLKYAPMAAPTLQDGGSLLMALSRCTGS